MDTKWKNTGEKSYGISSRAINLISCGLVLQVIMVALTLYMTAADRDSVQLTVVGIMTLVTILMLYGLGSGLYSFIKFERAEEKIYEAAKEGKEITPMLEAGELAELTEDIMKIQAQLKKSAEEQLKSEKLKMELITNVSHDLKTPLTSIISYIDLLKLGELPKEAADYVEVLSVKAGRLKDLVQDVFDMSKAASGNEIKMEQMDMNRLAEQTLADMSDRIEAAGKRVVYTPFEGDTPFDGDSNKMYRVVQNLLDNAIKYSMDGTRIYMNIFQKGDQFGLEIKNVSSYEMDFKADDMRERFVRADKSRNTEGSGLGLAIAQTYTESCGGTFITDIDGDVFRAGFLFKEVKMKKIQEIE